MYNVDSDTEMNTPVISEQENDYKATDSIKRKRGAAARSKNSKDRKKLKHKVDRARQTLKRLESVGHKVNDRPISDLTPQEVIELAKSHSILPGDTQDTQAQVVCLDLDTWVPHWKKQNGIKDTTKLFADQKVGIPESELRALGFKFLTHGTVYAFKNEGGEDTLIFSVSFYPLEQVVGCPNILTESERQDLAFLAVWLHYLKEHGNPVTTNSAHKGMGQVGIMQAAGWRAGSDKGFMLGLYAMKKMILDWVAHQKGIAEIARIFGNFFRKVAPNASAAAEEFVRKYQLPALETITYNPTGGVKAPACSLYVSHSNFYNAVHRDHDVSPLAFGIWLTTRGVDEKIVRDPNEVAAHIRGGQFFFPDYGIAIDFNRCGGIACVTWRAPRDRHATAYTETVDSPNQYVRWGSSIQVTKRTFDAVQRVQQLGGDIRDAQAYASGREGSGVGIGKRIPKVNKLRPGKDKKLKEPDYI